MENPQDMNRLSDPAGGRPRDFVYRRRWGASSFTSHMIFGLVIMVLGALWTLDNLGIVDSDQILRWWPAALIAAGAVKLVGLGSARNVVLGTLLVLVGSWGLLNNFDVVDVSIWQLWPLALVFIGFSILSRHGGLRLGARTDEGTLDAEGRAPTPDENERLSTVAIWSGVERKVLSQQFRGGDITAVMGGAEIDMRGARPVPSGAVLEVLAVWGGIDVQVPENWRVVNQATVIMGAIEDKTKIPPVESTHTLIIRGFVMMGGVEIKN